MSETLVPHRNPFNELMSCGVPLLYYCLQVEDRCESPDFLYFIHFPYRVTDRTSFVSYALGNNFWSGDPFVGPRVVVVDPNVDT